MGVGVREGYGGFVESNAFVGMVMIGMGVYGDDFATRCFGGMLIIPLVVRYSANVGRGVYDCCSGLAGLLRR